MIVVASDVLDGRLPAPDPSTTQDDAIELAWKYWDGGHWRALGRSSNQAASISSGAAKDYKFADGTKAFTGLSAKGSNVVTFQRPEDWAPSAISGKLDYWLRVRIAPGDYGRDAYYEKLTGGGLTLVPATWRPPSLSAMTLLFIYASPSATPQSVMVEANRTLTDRTSALAQRRGFRRFP